MSRSRLRLLFWRWHRRLGIAAAVFVLLVSITGILLNHTSALTLSERPVKQPWLLSLYGMKPPKVVSYEAGGQWVSHLGGEHLYLDDQELAYCMGSLQGAVALPEFSVAACGDELVLFTSTGEVIERIGAAYGIPRPISALVLCAGEPCLLNGDKYYRINLEQLDWQVYGGASIEQFKPQTLPEPLQQKLLSRYFGEAITWERVLLDLHSGHLLQMGPWLMDVVAVMLITLSLSGVTMWYSGQRRRSH